MKFLDERIELTVSLLSGTTAPAAGMYKYVVTEQIYQGGVAHVREVFVGNFYVDGTETTKTFDITDIVRNSKRLVTPEYLTNGTNYNNLPGYLESRFRITTYQWATPIYSLWEMVAMVYRYPNSKGALTDGSQTFFDSSTTTGTTETIRVALQGNKEGNLTLFPHYPLMETQNYKYVQNFLTTLDTQEIILEYRQSRYVDEYYNVSVSEDDVRSTMCAVKLSNFIDWSYVHPDMTKDMTIYLLTSHYDEDEDDTWYSYDICGYFDACPKRYYLMWQDRYGGYQSQAFNDFTKYSETFDVTETQNYKNERKKSFIQVQPKWTLKSGWLNETTFPFYESIYVSPVLILFDTWEDKSYNVIVNGNYVEKTYKDEKKMLNMTLELEAISKQNIIY